MNRATTPTRPAPYVLLWAIVALELFSPIPAFLTLGTIWVLLFRPPWFRELVDRLYAPEGQG